MTRGLITLRLPQCKYYYALGYSQHIINTLSDYLNSWFRGIPVPV